MARRVQTMAEGLLQIADDAGTNEVVQRRFDSRLRLALLVGLACLAALVLLGCSRVQFPEQGEPNQVAWGESVYRQECARCHEPGKVAPILTAERLVRYQNAKNLYEYVRNNMPLDKPGALPEADYWDVTAFILASDRILTVAKGSPLHSDNAAQAHFAPQ